MMKSHLLIDYKKGVTRCGRNAFANYLISVDDEKEATCKSCQRLTKRTPDACIGGQSHMVLSGKNKCMVCGKRVNRRGRKPLAASCGKGV